MAECLYCRCDRLAAVREPLEAGVPVICGRCAGLMVLDVDAGGEAILLRPGRDEALELRKDPDVVRFLQAYELDHVEAGMEEARHSPKAKRRSTRMRPGESRRFGPMTIQGPDA